MFHISRHQIETLFAHALEVAQEECCGLIGGIGEEAKSLYRLRNRASNPLNAYEASVEDLFEAQRSMRSKGEEILAIYHSHPRSCDPMPSETDVALAYYPSAIYIIIGLACEQPVLRAFRIYESEGRWEEVGFRISD
jgi:proteasome lid subunit RPN8/RPN11